MISNEIIEFTVTLSESYKSILIFIKSLILKSLKTVEALWQSWSVKVAVQST